MTLDQDWGSIMVTFECRPLFTAYNECIVSFIYILFFSMVFFCFFFDIISDTMVSPLKRFVNSSNPIKPKMRASTLKGSMQLVKTPLVQFIPSFRQVGCWVIHLNPMEPPRFTIANSTVFGVGGGDKPRIAAAKRLEEESEDGSFGSSETVIFVLTEIYGVDIADWLDYTEF